MQKVIKFLVKKLSLVFMKLCGKIWHKVDCNFSPDNLECIRSKFIIFEILKRFILFEIEVYLLKYHFESHLVYKLH